MAIDGKALVNPIAQWENFMETSEPARLSINSQASRHTAVMQTLPLPMLTNPQILHLYRNQGLFVHFSSMPMCIQVFFYILRL